VVFVEIGEDGRRQEPVLFPLKARPIYEVIINNPREEIPHLARRFPDAGTALVRYHVAYEAGKDILNDILAELDGVFPHWYDRTWQEAGELPFPEKVQPPAAPLDNVRKTVLDYLGRHLQDSRDRDELLGLAEALLVNDESA
jgi:hypothetical protein